MTLKERVMNTPVLLFRCILLKYCFLHQTHSFQLLNDKVNI